MEVRIISSRLCQVTVAIPVKDRPEDLRKPWPASMRRR